MSFRQDRTNPSTAVSGWKGRSNTPNGWPSTRVSNWLNGNLMSLGGGGGWAAQFAFDAGTTGGNPHVGGIWVDTANSDEIYWWCTPANGWTGYETRSCWGRMSSDASTHTWQVTIDNPSTNIQWQYNACRGLQDGTIDSDGGASDYIIGWGRTYETGGGFYGLTPLVVKKSDGDLYMSKRMGANSSVMYIAPGPAAMSRPENASARIIWGNRFYNPWTGTRGVWVARNNDMGGGAQAGTSTSYTASMTPIYKGTSGSSASGNLYSLSRDGSSNMALWHTNDGTSDFDGAGAGGVYFANSSPSGDSGYFLHDGTDSNVGYAFFCRVAPFRIYRTLLGSTAQSWAKTYSHSSGNTLETGYGDTIGYAMLDGTDDNILICGRVANPGTGDDGAGNYYHTWIASIKGSDGSVNWSRCINGLFDSANKEYSSNSISVYGDNVYVMMCPAVTGAWMQMLKFNKNSPPAIGTYTYPTTGDTIQIYNGNVSAATYGSSTAETNWTTPDPTSTSPLTISSHAPTDASATYSVYKVDV